MTFEQYWDRIHLPSDGHYVPMYDAAKRAWNEGQMRLRADLRWVMEQWLEATEDGEHIPAHECWFTTKPDAGYCPFHEEWFGAAEDCGLLNNWAEADAERG